MVVNILIQNSHNFAMTLISQDDHLTAGACAAFDSSSTKTAHLCLGKISLNLFSWEATWFSYTVVKKKSRWYWKLFKITYFFFLPTITRYQCLHSHVAWTEQIPNVSHSFFVLYFKLDFLFRNLFAIHVGNAFAEIHSLFSLSFHNQPPKRFRRNPDKKTWSYKYDSQRKHRFKATK